MPGSFSDVSVSATTMCRSSNTGCAHRAPGALSLVLILTLTNGASYVWEGYSNYVFDTGSAVSVVHAGPTGTASATSSTPRRTLRALMYRPQWRDQGCLLIDEEPTGGRPEDGQSWAISPHMDCQRILADCRRRRLRRVLCQRGRCCDRHGQPTDGGGLWDCKEQTFFIGRNGHSWGISDHQFAHQYPLALQRQFCLGRGFIQIPECAQELQNHNS